MVEEMSLEDVLCGALYILFLRLLLLTKQKRWGTVDRVL